MSNPTRAEVAYVCEHCGASRTARTLTRHLKLKCVGCGLTTSHEIAGVIEDGHLTPWERRDDWREETNQRECAKLRRAVFAEQFLTAAGVEVYDDRSSRDFPSGDIRRGGRRKLFSVCRDRRDGDDRWIVEVANDATLDGRLDALKRAAWAILAEEKLWGAEGDWVGWSYPPNQPHYLQDNE